jgi:hypothetical protein
LVILSPSTVFAAMAPGSVQARIDPDLRGKLQRFEARLEALRRDQGIPGLSAAIVKNGKVVYLEGLGSAAGGGPATPDTAYPVPSLTGSSGHAWTVRDLANLDVLLDHGAIVEIQPYLAWHTEDLGGHRLQWAWEHQKSGSILWLKVQEKKLSLILVGRGDIEKTAFATALMQAF